MKGQNFLSATRKIAINTVEEVFNIGDVVGHQDTSVGEATILSFEIDERIGEVKANTNKGYTHIDFIYKNK